MLGGGHDCNTSPLVALRERLVSTEDSPPEQVARRSLDRALEAVQARHGRRSSDPVVVDAPARARRRSTDTEQAPRTREPERPSSLVVERPESLLVGRYRLGEPIGHGGQASVHRGIHAHLDLPVAIKVFPLDGFSPADAEAIQRRFLREARTAARVRHRNVIAIHDAGQTQDGSPFLVMELIEGEDLSRRIARGPIGIPGIVDLGRQLFAALTALGEAGVLHRDVKPANVMLRSEPDGQLLLKLVDFGIARGHLHSDRLTATGAIVGTPHYMAPEHLRGEVLDVRADLYSACAVLYEATTGRPPFDGETTAHVVGSVLSRPLRPVRTLRARCPEALAELIEIGLSRARADRPPHALAMITALDRIVEGEGLATGARAWSEDASAIRTPPLLLAQRRFARPARERSPDEDRARREPPRDSEEEQLPIAQRPTFLTPRRDADAPPLAPKHRGRARAAALAGLLVALAIVLGAPRGATGTGTRPAPRPDGHGPPVAHADEDVDVEALLGEGDSARARNELGAALVHYRLATTAAPARPEAHRGRGLAAASAGRDDEAILALERYLSLVPDAPDARAVRAQLETVRARRRERRVRLDLLARP